ncbi:DNA-binding protein [Brucella tritici]|uniref:PPC domain-containing DNA-binding protein n=1 Tax=Brucella tritici TaxID=94626 RepID=UPI00124D6BAB|nr:PPC domain-containing DNA-binding protein [Brucella tritici]KAB2671712.1 DNA-binding protein [Brucella tritici]
MQSKLLSETGGQRTYVVVLDPGEEVLSTLTGFVREHRLTAASVSAIGAFRRAMLGFFDLDGQEYEHIPVDEQSEVLSLLGDCALDEKGMPGLHLHAVLGLRNGETRGGHLIEATVTPTLEVIIRENVNTMRRTFRPEFGIALIDPGQ